MTEEESELREENRALREQVWLLQEQIELLEKMSRLQEEVIEGLQEKGCLQEAVSGAFQQQIGERLAKVSHNSHLPPSSDRWAAARSLRKKSGKKAGGQTGHTGSTLHLSETPDEIIVHPVERCRGCQRDLRGVASQAAERRQVVDLPPKHLVITEDRAECKVCPACQQMTQAVFPKENYMKKNKLAFVYDAIYPYVKGGAEKRNYELSKRLAKQGYEVHIYGMKWWKGQEILIEEEGLYLHGICKPKPLYTKEGRRSIWQAIYFGIHCFKLIKEDFTVLECCGFPYFSLFTCKIISIIKGKKLFSTWHEVWGKNYWKEYLGELSIFGIVIEKLSILMPDTVITVSDTTAKRITKELRFRKPIFTIPNGIDYKEVEEISPSSIESDIIYAGRLLDFKNVDILIRAVSLIKEKKPSVKCMIIGDGPQRNFLELLTEELNLKDNVTFLGFQNTSQDVLALIKSSKVLVLPSTREGFGIVVLEANACGLPVVTIKDRNNAAGDLIENGKNGIVCSLNEEDIAETVKEILTSEKIASKDCIDFAKQFDWDENVDKIKLTFKLTRT